LEGGERGRGKGEGKGGGERESGSDVPHSSLLSLLSSFGEVASFAGSAAVVPPSFSIGWPVSRWAAKGSDVSFTSVHLSVRTTKYMLMKMKSGEGRHLRRGFEIRWLPFWRS